LNRDLFDPAVVALLARKELADARRNRWFLLYVVLFAGLAMGLAYQGVSELRGLGVVGYGRVSASLVNLVLLIVPLMGLTLGALALALERETGTLAYLLAQPTTVGELLAGKFLGLASALAAALLVGFGAGGCLLAAHGGAAPPIPYLLGAVLALLLALVSVSLGLLLSAAVRKTHLAIGLAVLLWAGLTLFGDLGVLGSALVLDMDVRQLLTATLCNPLQVYKIAAIQVSQGHLDGLGPVGQYALRTYGRGLTPLLVGLLLLWTLAPLTATYWVFRRRGVV
jgi:Cu-processing system permease protein